MLLSELNKVVKYVGDRCLFKTGDLKVYTEDRVGVVGANGAGKTMLLQIIAQRIQPDGGTAILYKPCSYITQFEVPCGDEAFIDPCIARQLRIAAGYSATMSGGERARYKIAAALSGESLFMLADEPTANLDIKGIEIFQQKLQEFEGGLVIASHDRALLDAVCNTIWEVGGGMVREFKGKFRDYLAAKEIEWKQQESDYNNYIREKEKLEASIAERRQQALSTKKTPKRMGNAEARLHKLGNQKAQARLSKAAKAMESRLQKLEVKKRPKKAPVAAFGITVYDDLHSRVVLHGERINKSYGDKTLFHNARFSVFNGQKVALVGENGCGKTTLLKMIVGEEGINAAPGARLGYFGQMMEELETDKSVLANMMSSSGHDEGTVRNLLAQLLFRRDDVFKPVSVLSGGERVRLALAKIIAGDANVLLLDEPTNYLDLPSLMALETVLKDYGGVILFASHDRDLIDAVASHLMLFENGEIRLFPGNYRQYLEYKKKKTTERDTEGILLEHRLAEVLSNLSLAKDELTVARLDQEYQELLNKIRLLRN